MAEPATYVFCLVQSVRTPSLKGVPAGMPGAGMPRALAVDTAIWAIVADAPLERFSGEPFQEELQDLEAVSRHALAHASIIEFFFQRYPVIPLKLFTLFSTDERARRELAGKKSQLRRLFKQLQGLEEWGVRITGAAAVAPPVPARMRSGRDYLEVKRRLRDLGSAPARSTIKDLNNALTRLSRLAAKTQKERFPPPHQGTPYLAGASFLVKTAHRSKWKKRATQLEASLGKQGHRLELSGPWPPYHFVGR